MLLGDVQGVIRVGPLYSLVCLDVAGILWGPFSMGGDEQAVERQAHRVECWKENCFIEGLKQLKPEIINSFPG